MDEQHWIQQWEQEAGQPFQGWDFSYLDGRYHEESPPWSYPDKVRAALRQADSLLDMGTGGGELLLELRDWLPPRTVATEGYPPNFAVAQAHLQPHGIPVIPYDSESNPHMPFADGSFAAIINRHESFSAPEVARVLRPGGRFCTQQVDGRDMADLYSLFGVRSAYEQITLENLRAELSSAGLRIEEALDWQGKVVFADVGALVYFLHAVPWEAPPDFSVRRYRDVLLALHQRPRLEFSIRRFYLQGVRAG